MEPTVTAAPHPPVSEETNPDAYEIYLCGPITASTSGTQAFRDAAAVLRRTGFTVFNPAESPEEVHGSWSAAMRADLGALLATTRALIVLPGWDRGVGSRIEVLAAVSVGLAVHEFDADRGIGALVVSGSAGREGAEGLLFPAVPAAASAMPTAPIADDAYLAAAGSPDENLGERPHEEAARIVLGPRGAFYDHPFDNFARTGFIWTGVLYSKLREGEVVTPEDVALCMTGVKIAREAFRHKRDNLVDGHGYLLTHEMVLEERARREGQHGS